MPALEARLSRLFAAHTFPVGISVDSQHSHAAWAAALGGISLPLLADFHPKGAVGKAYGTYLEAAGLDDRATVLVDAAGIVRYAESVTPGGKRDIEALVAACEALDASFDGDLPTMPSPPEPPTDMTLFVRDHCMFSRWALYARANLHLDGALPVRNVSVDAQARADLEALGGKAQAPALQIGDEVMYESQDIVARLTGACAPLL